MKNIILRFACIALLPIAGCSPTHTAANLKSETGRGTFVSATGEVVTAIYSNTGDSGNHATVNLILPDKREMELYAATSGSGTRYTNGIAEWWEHQGQATYGVGGTNVFLGKLESSSK